MIKVAPSCFVPKSSVNFISTYGLNKIQNRVLREKKTNPDNVIDFTNGKKTLSVIELKNNKIILVNTKAELLYDRWKESRWFNMPWSLIIECLLLGIIIGMLLIVCSRNLHRQHTKVKPKEYSREEARRIDLRDRKIIEDSMEKEKERQENSFGFSNDNRMK